MSERIGLEAVLQDAEFQAGVGRYTDSVNKMGTDTAKAGAQAEKSMGGVSTTAIALGAAAVGGVVALGKALWDCTQAAMAEEVGIASLGAAVNATGVSWDSVSTSVEAYIAAAQRRTAFDDGVQRTSLTALTTTTGSLEQAMALLPLAMDMARAKGMELSAASEIVGKVAMGNTGILSRYGIVLGENATAQDALAAMQAKFAGQAEAYGQTTAAQFSLITQQIDNAKEEIGMAFMPVLLVLMTALASLAGEIAPMAAAAIGFLKEHASIIIPVLAAMATTLMVVLIPAFVAWATAASAAAMATIAALAPVLIPVAAVGAAVALLAVMWSENWMGIRDITQTAIDTIKTIIDTAMSVITTIIDTGWGLIKGIFTVWLGLIMALLTGQWDVALQIVTTAAGKIAGAIQTLWETVKTATGEALGLVLGIVKNLLNDAMNAISGFSLADAGRNFIQSLADGITGATGAIVDAVKRAVQSAVRSALSALGIGSPSKVGLALGFNFGASIGMGALDALKPSGSMIGNALAGLTASAMSPARVTAPAMTTHNTTINYNLSAMYRNHESEGSLRDTVRLLQAGVS